MESLFNLLDVNGDPLINNYREVQDTNGRVIKYVSTNPETAFEYLPCTTGFYAVDPSYECLGTFFKSNSLLFIIVCLYRL